MFVRAWRAWWAGVSWHAGAHRPRTWNIWGMGTWMKARLGTRGSCSASRRTHATVSAPTQPLHLQRQ